jgi:hypothetical protein
VPLSASFGLTASGILTRSIDLSVPVDAVSTGGAGLATFPGPAFDLTDGSGDLQALNWFHDMRALTAGSFDSIVLTNLLSPFGYLFDMATVRAILVVIDQPGPTKKLRIGPQAQANVCQLGFGGVGAEAYVEFDRFVLLQKAYGSGWPVTAATADRVPIKNTGSVDLQYALWVLGT